MPEEGAITGTPHHARVHARASASAGLSCAPPWTRAGCLADEPPVPHVRRGERGEELTAQPPADGTQADHQGEGRRRESDQDVRAHPRRPREIFAFEADDPAEHGGSDQPDDDAV